MIHSMGRVWFQAVYRVFDLGNKEIVIDNFISEIMYRILFLIN